MAAGLAALLLSLGVHTDKLFFLVPLLVVLAFERKLDWRAAVGLGVLASATVAGIYHFAHNYGWTVLMRRCFASGLIHPAAEISPISPSEYLVS